MQTIIKWIVTAIADYTIGYIIRLIAAYKLKKSNKEESKKKDEVLENSTDEKERDEAHESILNP